MKLFRNVLAALIFLLASQEAIAWWKGAAPGSFFNNGGLQINRSAGSYYTGMDRWLNVWQQGSVIQIVSSTNGTLNGLAAWAAIGASGQPYFDPATGELKIPVQSDVTSYGRGLFAPASGIANNAVPNAIYGPSNVGSSGAQGKWWLGVVYNLEWTGTISTAGTKITNTGTYGTGGPVGLGTIGGCGSNCVTVTLGNTVEANNLALLFVIDASNRSDPPRNIKFYPAQFATQAHSADLATRLINPDWLSQWGVVGVVRWMTENGETNLNAMTDFSQLAEYTFNSVAQVNSYTAPTAITYPAGTNRDYGPKGGIGPQTVCVVQNKIGAHAHWNIPYGANGTFGTQAAQAFDGCMNPGLQVWYEYCNEIWNFGAAFHCFPYLSAQPWPPLGPSAPYQQAASISGISTGATTTITTTAPHGYSNGKSVGFSINTSDTISVALNSPVSASISNVTASTFDISINTTGLSYSSGGTTFGAGSASLRGGYNSAQQMNQIYAAYGPSKRARWQGILGGQLTGSGGLPLSAVTGALFFVTNESVGSGACAPNLCLQDLYDTITIAPYAGNASYNGTGIQGITIGATPTVTASGHTFTNGQTIRIYVKTGMTQINNMTATVSGVSSSTFTININTTGFSAWSTAAGNFAIDNALPKAADDSIALNISTPGTYPTKYSYFAEQMTDATLNGTSVSNPSFGYVVGSGGNYRSLASCGLSCIPGIMLDNANLAGRYGLQLSEYEGAQFSTYIDTNGTAYVSTTTTLFDFFENWQYDAGTATHGPAEISSAHVAASQAAGVGFPSMLSEEGAGPGPFNGTRYFGDNPATLPPLMARNGLGPFVVSRPAKTWSIPLANTYPTSAANRSQKPGTACSSCTDSFTPTFGTAAAQGFVVVSDTGSLQPTSVTCDSVPFTPYAQATASGTSSVWTGALSAGAATRTCNIVYSGTGQNFQFREYYAFSVFGLTNTTPTAQLIGTTQSGQTANNFTANTDSLVITVAARPGFLPTMLGVATPIAANPATATVLSDLDGTTAGYGVFNPSWGSTLMNAWSSNSSSGPQSTAVFH